MLSMERNSGLMMRVGWCICFILIFKISVVHNGIIGKQQKGTSEVIGLYETSDKIVILTHENFDSTVLNKPNAFFVEFYNSWCGHCKRFAPSWKAFGADVRQWNHVVSVAAIDCAEDKNTGICRDYEIFQYPTVKYFHQKFKSGADKIGEVVATGESPDNMRKVLVNKLLLEQSEGRGAGWPLLGPQQYQNLDQIWNNIPLNVKAMFFIFESDNATMGTEIILDLNMVYGIGVRKISNSSSLVKSMNIVHFPDLVAVERDLSYKVITPPESTRHSFRKAIINYTQSNKFKGAIELNDFDDEPDNPASINDFGNLSSKEIPNVDTVYQADLETALRYTLTHEISKIKHISGDAFIALQSYLQVLVKYFPFAANGKSYLSDLSEQVSSGNLEWTGEKFGELVHDLEYKHSSAYTTLPRYVGCKGSAPQYRGFTCGLWTMFHVLTVNAANKKTSDASEVLKAIHGFVKYFFGCTECSENFQKMAVEQFKSVAETDGAIIWLWTAHNEVNHRLAGDPTEDPFHPKKQFPTAEHCPSCRDVTGAWNFKEVLLYLKHVYGVRQISLSGAIPLNSGSPNFSSLDSFLYMSVCVYLVGMLFLALRCVLHKRIYKKKIYIHDSFGKV